MIYTGAGQASLDPLASAIAPDTELAPSEIWVGAPARRVPLTVGEVSADAHALGGPALLKNRLVDIANHYFIVLLMSLFVLCGLWLLAGSLFPTSAHVDLGARFLASFALLCWLSFGLPLWLLPLLRIDTELLRWLCVEDEEIRSEGFRRDTWKYNVWHLLSNHLLPFALLTDVFAGTPIQSWLARRLGARVGAGAYFANGVGIREFTFTRIGAGAALNRGAGLIAHSELPSGRIVMKDITLGAGSSMGLGSYGVGGTELPAGLLLGSLSRPFDSQQLEAGCEYDNTPCQQRQRSAARPA